MDSTTWYRGKNVKAQYETSGRQIDLPSFAVAMLLAAREQGFTLEEIVQQLILANDFESATSKLDQEKTIRELGF